MLEEKLRSRAPGVLCIGDQVPAVMRPPPGPRLQVSREKGCHHTSDAVMDPDPLCCGKAGQLSGGILFHGHDPVRTREG